MNRDHLHIHALSVHVLQTLLRREAQFWRLDTDAFSRANQSAQTVPRLMAKSVPGLSGIDALPETLWHQMGMNVDGPHVHLLTKASGLMEKPRCVGGSSQGFYTVGEYHCPLPPAVPQPMMCGYAQVGTAFVRVDISAHKGRG